MISTRGFFPVRWGWLHGSKDSIALCNKLFPKRLFRCVMCKSFSIITIQKFFGAFLYLYLLDYFRLSTLLTRVSFGLLVRWINHDRRDSILLSFPNRCYHYLFLMHLFPLVFFPTCPLFSFTTLGLYSYCTTQNLEPLNIESYGCGKTFLSLKGTFWPQITPKVFLHFIHVPVILWFASSISYLNRAMSLYHPTMSSYHLNYNQF